MQRHLHGHQKEGGRKEGQKLHGDEQLRKSKREQKLVGSPGMKYGAQPGTKLNGKGMLRPYAPLTLLARRS